MQFHLGLAAFCDYVCCLSCSIVIGGRRSPQTRSNTSTYRCDSVEQKLGSGAHGMCFVCKNKYVLGLAWASHSGSVAFGDAFGLPTRGSYNLQVFFWGLIRFRNFF